MLLMAQGCRIQAGPALLGKPTMKNHLLVLMGALLGGILGHVACVWMYHQGYYAMVLPGGLAGVGAAFFRSRSIMVHLVCGLWGLVIALLTEWHIRPFIADGSFTYFLAHITALLPVALLMIAGGALLAFFLPFNRGRGFARPQDNPPAR